MLEEYLLKNCGRSFPRHAGGPGIGCGDGDMKTHEKSGAVPVVPSPMSYGFTQTHLIFLRHPHFFHVYWLSGNEALIQEEILNPDILNTVFIPPRFHIIFYDDDFLEGIRNSDQGSNLLFFLSPLEQEVTEVLAVF